MAKKKSNLSERSKCCGAKVMVCGKTTMYYVCLTCGKACDTYYKERIVWTINPFTKIKEDEREKTKTKLTKKEIENFRANEDF